MDTLAEARRPLTSPTFKKLRAEAIADQLREVEKLFGPHVAEDAKSPDSQVASSAHLLMVAMKNVMIAARGYAIVLDDRILKEVK